MLLFPQGQAWLVLAASTAHRSCCLLTICDPASIFILTTCLAHSIQDQHSSWISFGRPALIWPRIQLLQEIFTLLSGVVMTRAKRHLIHRCDPGTVRFRSCAPFTVCHICLGCRLLYLPVFGGQSSGTRSWGAGLMSLLQLRVPSERVSHHVSSLPQCLPPSCALVQVLRFWSLACVNSSVNRLANRK